MRIDTLLESDDANHCDVPIYSDEFSGIAYEQYCRDLFERIGWQVKSTKASGDQGVDLLCAREGVLLAIQCKKSSSQVGNGAVQEVYAGKGFYSADFAAVVTNNAFTKSAKALANDRQVFLLHHDEIASYCFPSHG